MIDGKETKIYDGFVRILYDDDIDGAKAKIICLAAQGTKDDECICLDDCLDLVEYNKNKGVVYVTFDHARYGTIYQYGNYNDGQWHKYADTRGFT